MVFVSLFWLLLLFMVFFVLPVAVADWVCFFVVAVVAAADGVCCYVLVGVVDGVCFFCFGCCRCC